MRARVRIRTEARVRVRVGVRLGAGGATEGDDEAEVLEEERDGRDRRQEQHGARAVHEILLGARLVRVGVRVRVSVRIRVRPRVGVRVRVRVRARVRGEACLELEQVEHALPQADEVEGEAEDDRCGDADASQQGEAVGRGVVVQDEALRGGAEGGEAGRHDGAAQQRRKTKGTHDHLVEAGVG